MWYIYVCVTDIYIIYVTVDRLQHSGKTLGAHDSLLFQTRSGTRQGVEMHVFRVETQRDLSSWSRTLVQGAHTAAVLVKEVTCRK